MTAFGQLPLSFFANPSPTGTQADFVAQGPGYTVDLSGGQAVLGLQDAQGTVTLTQQLVGAAGGTAAQGVNPLPGVVNELIGNDPSQWHTGIPTFAGVSYANVYPGVEVTYDGSQGRLESDFTVAPGADPNVIRLSFTGGTGLTLDAAGDLVVHTAAGDVAEQAPAAYQTVDGTQQAVASRFVIKPDGTVGFSLGSYNPSLPLVIDPVLGYSTYLGGSGQDSGNGIAVDAQGNAYIVGSTMSTDFPTKNGIAGQTGDTRGNAFVAKLNPAGTALVASTYLGGNGSDAANGVAVDQQTGDVYVVGTTSSTNFPTQSPVTPGGLADFVSVSSDGGATWSARSSGITDNIQSVAVDPTNPSVAYVGTRSSGVFKTTDGGATWSAINQGLTSQQLVNGATAIVVDPTTPTTVYLGTGDGLFKSTDGGGSWTAINSGLGNALEITALAIDPKDSSILYAGTLFGVYQSTNGGTSWSKLTNAPGEIAALTVDPNSPANVYASSALGGLFKSTDSGANWAPVNTGLSLGLASVGNFEVTSVVVDPTNSSTVYAAVSEGFPLGAGVFKSTDGGATWTPIDQGLSDLQVNQLAIDPANPATLYAATNTGVFQTTNGGTSWTLDARGPRGSVNVLAVTSAAGATTVYAGSDIHSNAFVAELNPALQSLVYSTYLGGSSTDSGSGIAVDSNGDAYVVGTTSSADFPTTAGAVQTTYGGSAQFDSNLFVVEIGPSGKSLVYSTFLGGDGADTGAAIAVDGQGNAYVAGAASSSNFPTKNPIQAQLASGPVSRSSDGGTTWSSAVTGLNGTVQALAVDPTTATTVYAGTDRGMFKSTDGGATWTAIDTGLAANDVLTLAIAPGATHVLYAGTTAGLFQSTDGGAHWTESDTGLTDHYVTTIAVDPQDASVLYAGTGAGVFKSSDGGATWSAADTGIGATSIDTLAINPANPSILYAGTGLVPIVSDALEQEGRVFESTDGGASWSPLNVNPPGLSVPPLGDITGLAIDPSHPSTVYVAIGSDLFKSTDGGSTFATATVPGLSQGLEGNVITALAVSPTNSTVYAGTGPVENPSAGGLGGPPVPDFGLFESTDGGTTWSAATGLSSTRPIVALALAPSNASDVYLGGSAQTDAVAARVNAGGGSLGFATYFGGGADDSATGIAIDRQGTIDLAGSTASDDLPTKDALQATFGGEQDAFLARLGNGGSTLTYATYLGGSGVDSAAGLAVDPGGNAYLVGTTDSVDFPIVDPVQGTVPASTLARSQDAGSTWSTSETGLNGSVTALAIAPSQPSTIYAGTFTTSGLAAAISGGVSKSTDAGASWTSVNTGLLQPVTKIPLDVTVLAVDPTTASTAYAGTSQGLFKTTDGGAHWTPLGIGAESVAIDPANTSILYAGVANGGIFQSTDAGAHWTAINTGLGDVSFAHVDSIVIDPKTPSTVYATFSDVTGGGTTAGVVKSTDSGADWTFMTNGLGSGIPSSLVIDPKDPSTLYVVASTGQTLQDSVFQSTDGAASWTAVSNGLPSNSSLSHLTIDPSNPATLYVIAFGGAANSSSLFKTTNSGGSWAPVSLGSITQPINTVAVDPTNSNNVYLGLESTGSQDAFVTEINTSGTALVSSSHLGGGGNDTGTAIAVDAAGNAYVTGSTASTDFPTQAPLQKSLGGTGATNAFVAKIINPLTAPGLSLSLQPAQPAPGQSFTITATVTPGSGTGTPTGTVTFFIDNQQVGQPVNLAVVNGENIATFTTSFPAPGSHTVTALYSGNSTFATGGSNPLPLTVANASSSQVSTTTQVSATPNPATVGQTVTIQAIVSAASGTPTGSVVFTIDGTAGQPIALQTVNGQQVASFQTSSLAVGLHTIAAQYQGNATFAGSFPLDPVHLTINTPGSNLIATTTQISVSPSPSTVGQVVVLGATVSPTSGSGTPTGSVTFFINGVAQPPVNLDATGSAQLIRALPGGTDTITAQYGGDPTFAASPSNVVQQTVNPLGTMVQLGSSPNPAAAGQTVTLTVTLVHATPPPSEVAAWVEQVILPAFAGTVTLLDGGKPIASEPVSGTGQATFQVSTLSVGTHAITAHYSGDPNFAAGDSNLVSQVITAAPAPPVTTAGSTSTSPTIPASVPQLTEVLRFGFHWRPTVLVLGFNGPLSPGLAQDLNAYRIVGFGGRGIGLGAAVYNAGSDSVTLFPQERLNVHRRYVLTVSGAGLPSVVTLVTRRNLVVGDPVPGGPLGLRRAVLPRRGLL